MTAFEFSKDMTIKSTCFVPKTYERYAPPTRAAIKNPEYKEVKPLFQTEREMVYSNTAIFEEEETETEVLDIPLLATSDIPLFSVVEETEEVFDLPEETDEEETDVNA